MREGKRRSDVTVGGSVPNGLSIEGTVGRGDGKGVAVLMSSGLDWAAVCRKWRHWMRRPMSEGADRLGKRVGVSISSRSL